LFATRESARLCEDGSVGTPTALPVNAMDARYGLNRNRRETEDAPGDSALFRCWTAEYSYIAPARYPSMGDPHVRRTETETWQMHSGWRNHQKGLAVAR
jgi:hypothetical protein